MRSEENRRILVIDDEPALHDDFRSVLVVLEKDEADDRMDRLEANLFGRKDVPSAAGFEVTFAQQGEEGLDRARAALAGGHPFAVAFIDMRMPPGWDGMRTVKELWDLDPRLQVVFCTAYSDFSWHEVLESVDAKDRVLVVKKPFDPIEIWLAANTLGAKWKAERRAGPCRAEVP